MQTSGSVWIDADPGIGLPWVDVHGALAIHALHAAQIPIAGLSTCFGNASLDRVHPVAQHIGRRLGIDVVKGAGAPADRDTAAVDALVAHTGTVLALAPLTNVAAALERGAQWQRLIVLGGTTARGPNIRRVRTTELNRAEDLRAAATVLQTDPDLVPMEPCRRVWLRKEHLGILPAWLGPGCRSWLRRAPVPCRRRALCHWDLVAAMWLVKPDLFEIERGRAVLVSDPFRRGHVEVVEGPSAIVRDVAGPELIAAWIDVLTASNAGVRP